MEGSPASSKGVLLFTMQKLYSNFLLVLFPRVTPEPGLQCHVSFEAGLCHVLSRPSPEQHDLRLLRRALFPGRYWAVSHAKTAFLLKVLEKSSKNGRPLVGRPFLREERLSNARGRGLCEANAGHAPRRMVCWGPGIVGALAGALVGALAQALLWKKSYSNFLLVLSRSSHRRAPDLQLCTHTVQLRKLCYS